jgi:predicted membrane protein
VTPILVLSYMFWRGTTGNALVMGVAVSACLVLMSVFMMRWNVVIGGQEIAKTGKGLLNYHVLFLHKEGLIAALSIVAAPFGLLYAATRLLPPWADAKSASADAASIRIEELADKAVRA